MGKTIDKKGCSSTAKTDNDTDDSSDSDTLMSTDDVDTNSIQNVQTGDLDIGVSTGRTTTVLGLQVDPRFFDEKGKSISSSSFIPTSSDFTAYTSAGTISLQTLFNPTVTHSSHANSVDTCPPFVITVTSTDTIPTAGVCPATTRGTYIERQGVYYFVPTGFQRGYRHVLNTTLNSDSVNLTSDSDDDSDMASHDLMPPKYSGKMDIDPQTWLRDMNDYMHFKKLTGDADQGFFAMRLDGMAKIWYDGLDATQKANPEVVKALFLDKFQLNRDMCVRISAEAWASKQGKLESVDDFVDRVVRTARKINMKEDQVCFCISNGFKLQLRRI